MPPIRSLTGAIALIRLRKDGLEKSILEMDGRNIVICKGVSVYVCEYLCVCGMWCAGHQTSAQSYTEPYAGTARRKLPKPKRRTPATVQCATHQPTRTYPAATEAASIFWPRYLGGTVRSGFIVLNVIGRGVGAVGTMARHTQSCRIIMGKGEKLKQFLFEVSFSLYGWHIHRSR